MTISRFKLYEETVQSPDWQVDYLPQFHQWLTGKRPFRFREDFCGSARIACEWVRRNPRHSAIGLDLDRKVLDYAKKENISNLTPDERSRIRLLRQDVLKAKTKPVDWIGVFNYSIFTFHERATLVRYFRAAHRSLSRSGTLFLEVACGPDFLRASLERRTLRIRGIGRITQAWEQQEYDPLTGLNHYAIHFRLPDGNWMQNAFHYHWRIWGIPELRDALHDAGFADSIVIVEKDPGSREPSNEFMPVESLHTGDAPPSSFFLAYVIAKK